MDSYRSQYSFSPNGFNANNNVHSPRPGTYSPGPINYSPGFNSPEMPRPYTPAEGNGTQVKKPKTMAQWVAAAKESTHKIRRDGSLSPLVWVLVEGTNIPSNAIIGGEDRRKPLYIARTFYEGGIYIGKAGHHLRLGAAIPYNGREIEVSTYEVLVPALQPMRYAISDTLQIPEIPRMLREQNHEVEGLQRLNLMKTVILVDDSTSMAGALWGEAREALAGVADLNAKVSSDGVDVYFLNNLRSAVDMKDGNEVRQLFDAVIPEGQTPTGAKLQELFDRYIPLLEDQRLAHKPISIVVITDGVPTDELQEVIIAAARRLDQTGVPINHFGIQFAQIGDDEDATEALKELDEGIAEAHGIRDMVDTTPCNPNDSHFTTATVIKILLGAINERFDSTPIGRPPFPKPVNSSY